VEGKFYVWKKEELSAILNEDAEMIGEFYNVKPEGNWEHGNNILMQTQHESVFQNKYNLQPEEWKTRLREAKDKLLVVRDTRIPPGLDDKIILSWNAMTICGLTDAYRFIGDEKFLIAALKNMKFLENELMDGSTLYRSFKEKRSGTKAFLDDYAYVIQAFLKLYQVTFDEYWIKRAEVLTHHTVNQFFDEDDGFFYYTSQDSEKLIARRKEIFDNVIPASNSVMMQTLFQLGTILENEKWREIAESSTNSLAHMITAEPNYLSNWGIAWLEIKKGVVEVVFAGRNQKQQAREFMKAYQPFALLFGAVQNSAIPLTEGKEAAGNASSVYVCQNKTCQRPVGTIEEALGQIEMLKL
jgi:uncharacterized protein YyaL (SSP411 family)